MKTIVIADDHHIIRQGLRALLAAEPDFSIIGEASDGLDAVRLVTRLQPDVLIVDLLMPGLNGSEVARQVRQRSSNTVIIILSMHSNEAYVLEALRNGVSGYVLKDSHTSDLVRAVREVAAGGHYLSPPLSERAVDLYVQKAEATTLDLYETLTTREREVLQLGAEGHTHAEIAARLFISPRTAECHRASLMRKLGLKNHTELIRYALLRGILPLR